MTTKTKTPKMPTRRVPRPIIALAAPSTLPPSANFERKHKGGELGWNLSGAVTERLVKRQIEMARLMIIGAVGLEAFEKNLRLQHQGELEANLEASIEKVKKAKEEGGK